MSAKLITPTSERYRWMDISRGLGVLLIVVVHAGSIFAHFAQAALPHSIRILDLAFAPYRIPLLIFLSGILLQRSLAKGSERFISGKAKNLLWPYLLWTVLCILSEGRPEALLTPSPWLGGTVLWYMLFLFVFYAVGLVFARSPYLIVAVYALAAAMLMPDNTKYGERLFLLMSYFFVGAFVGQNLDRFTSSLNSKWVIGLAPIVVGLSSYSILNANLKYSPFFAGIVLAAVIGVCGVLNLVSAGRIASVLQYIGKNSLVYYVVHAPVYAVLYRVLLANGFVNVYVFVSSGLFAALSISTFLSIMRNRSVLVRLLFEGPDLKLGARGRHCLTRLGRVFDRVFVPVTKPSIGSQKDIL